MSDRAEAGIENGGVAAAGPSATARAGRKRAGESRAAEIRARLAAWRRTPEMQRGSLRALACEMGCSHQLLGFYLRNWDRWQGRECMRESNEIQARANAENRELTAAEWAQIIDYRRASLRCSLRAGMDDKLRKIETEAWAASFVLPKGTIWVVREVARMGVSRAQAILQRCADRGNGL
jgi:hypothetical protein